ncbi:hypothetical protein N7468_004833 [Penicillium chermesinum]|uniref:DUF7918 domain-containing protein n=1 Tax=Penicillium chermesinum TaxID=63820 RepID=A0A9W9P925_9EURO|nr:uncharacterized protein N7468_004833 [Penicillium chermesinum]KAJ5240214.1 hypothetical protein N7468_004833 [Penicillium chermesinum]
MPCFKGLAVSIHTPDGPIPEYSIQRQSRASRIGCFIPVPPPLNGKPEQSTFAISITLLNPGQDVPYSTPKPTADEPSPKPKVVGGLPGKTSERGQYSGAVAPYQALTNSPNETVAAYIYFDGRQKEEVATLLRRGEETWLRGGGIAEREFLFREVGLERWLNGLDLEGKDAAAKIERRRQKVEKRRAKRLAEGTNMEEDMSAMELEAKTAKPKNIMRYGNDAKAPLENVSDDDLSSDSDDDDPIPETAGQIKVALFRVLASGEIKRGEYSPQFDAHDDDEEGGQGNSGGDADVDHTTSFAKPKSLDPKSISTQTVTGIDPTDKPYAIFTFMYRGEREFSHLGEKMGILKDSKSQDTPAAKRKSLQADLASLGPLKPGGTVGFMNFRESNSGRKQTKGEDDMDSDDDDTDNPILSKADDEETKDDNRFLSPDDIKREGELEEGVRKIRLKRQHSAEPGGSSVESPNSPSASGTTPPAPERATTPPKKTTSTAGPSELSQPPPETTESFIGSPLKKQRASVSMADENALRRRIAESSGRINEVLGNSTNDSKNASAGAFGTNVNNQPIIKTEDEDEEL